MGNQVDDMVLLMVREEEHLLQQDKWQVVDGDAHALQVTIIRDHCI